MDAEVRRLQKLARPRAKLGGPTTLESQHIYKADAEERAGKLKYQGHDAKVVKGRGLWLVYYNPSRKKQKFFK